MKLVQKLTIGLSLACTMMLSSCSKEDALTPEPKVDIVNSNSSLKTEGLPWLPPTKGYAGINTLPNFWERYEPIYHSDPAKYPAGTSSLTSLWGNGSMPWMQSLSAIPGQPWTSFVTVLTSSQTDFRKQSLVKTKVKFLTDGNKYSLTFYVATSLPKLQGRGTVTPTFAKECKVWLGSSFITTIDLTSYKNTWMKKTITFKAHGSEMDFNLRASPAQEGQYAYAHIFVGQDAIVEVK